MFHNMRLISSIATDANYSQLLSEYLKCLVKMHVQVTRGYLKMDLFQGPEINTASL